MIFIHKTPVVESHPTTREIKRFTMAQVHTDRKHGLFIYEQHAHLHTENTQKKVSNIASDEDIIENNYMFVMLYNLSVISHWIFPECFFLFLAPNLKITLEAT